MTTKPLPPTKDGFRYHYGEDDTHLCKSYIDKQEANDTLKRLSFTKRKAANQRVRLSENDRAPQLKLDPDGLRVTGEKGYCMVRATHSMNRGRFYYELTIEKMSQEQRDESEELTAARIGWGQRFANLQAPLGYDLYGYSYRSRFGTKFHQAKGKTYDARGGYGQGDTIGCMIELPYGNNRNLTQAHHLPVSIKQTGYIVSVKRKEQLRVLEERDDPPAKMSPLPGSKISFYKNGRFLGVAFEDIFEGFYFPTISLYKNCSVTVNFGPNFKYSPPAVENGSKLPWRPVTDMVEISVIDDLLSDMLYVISQETDPKGNQLELLIKKGLMN